MRSSNESEVTINNVEAERQGRSGTPARLIRCNGERLERTMEGTKRLKRRWPRLPQRGGKTEVGSVAVDLRILWTRNEIPIWQWYYAGNYVLFLYLATLIF